MGSSALLPRAPTDPLASRSQSIPPTTLARGRLVDVRLGEPSLTGLVARRPSSRLHGACTVHTCNFPSPPSAQMHESRDLQPELYCRHCRATALARCAGCSASGRRAWRLYARIGGPINRHRQRPCGGRRARLQYCYWHLLQPELYCGQRY